FIVGLALKNLFRYRRRTLITALAIAAGVAMYIFIDGWLQGAEMESVRNLVKYETGSARVMHQSFWDDHEFLLPKYSIDNPRAVMSALSEAGYSVTPRINVWADVYTTGGQAESVTMQLVGIDVTTDDRVFALEGTIPDGNGKFISAGQPEIVLGSDVADRLEVKPGGTVQISTKTKDGVWTGMQVRVTGILFTPDPIVNNSMGFVPLHVLQSVLQMPGRVTDVVVGFPEWKNPDKEDAAIAGILAGIDGADAYTVKNYNELASEFGMIVQSKSAGTKVLLFLIFIIAAIGVSNTMLMAVYERFREIGMMRAMGMKDRSIIVSFFIEAMGIGIVGAAIGVTLGVLADFYMVNVGIDLSYFINDMGNIGYRITGISRSAWNPGTILQAGIFSIVFSGLVAIFPARRALKKQITDCLRVK
ncbi:MAG TPA: ABC transporter permease, partial [Spirochaetia bacterium]|nr:ABC transporter permease [Spirochaetia bacterium]